ncbi:MAG: ribonuclease H-like domain-containing protein [archaeon]|nr:ribonuclease H-like domain-containing protein [archaeon]
MYEDELSNLPLVGYSRAQLLKRMGINSISKLACAEPTKLISNPLIVNHKDGSLKYQIPMILNYAKAALYGKPIINGVSHYFHTPDDKVTFMDLEYDPSGPHIFLCGSTTYKGYVRQFFIEEKKGASLRLIEFLGTLSELGQTVFTYSSTSADEPMLKKCLLKYGLKTEVLSRLNICDLFYDVIFTQKLEKQRVYLPIKRMDEKTVSEYLGYKPPPSLKIRDGLECLAWYEHYQGTRDDNIKKEILLYNKCDLERIKFIYEELKKLFMGYMNYLAKS